MLRVRVTDKIYDTNDTLVGYTIQNEDNPSEVRNIYKNDLKNALINNQCEVVNMVMTKDGRLMGQAKSKPKNVNKVKQPTGSGVALCEVYTNGRKLVGGLINNEVWLKRRGLNNPTKYNGIDLGFDFMYGSEINKFLQQGYFDNVHNVNGKLDMSKVKRKSFSKVKTKLMNMLKNNGISFELKVGTDTEKYKYIIKIINFERFSDLMPMVNAIYCLVEDTLVSSKIKLLYIDEDNIYVENASGIKDVRQALKDLKI